MMRFLCLLAAGLSLAHSARADVTAFDDQLGATRLSEDQYQIVIHAQPAVTVAILPGGKLWPALSIDEAGRIYAGGAVIVSATGRVVTRPDAVLALPHGVEVAVLDERYRFRRGGKECRLSPRQLHLDEKRGALAALREADLVLSSASDTLLALATRFGEALAQSTGLRPSAGQAAGRLAGRTKTANALTRPAARNPPSWPRRRRAPGLNALQQRPAGAPEDSCSSADAG